MRGAGAKWVSGPPFVMGGASFRPMRGASVNGGVDGGGRKRGGVERGSPALAPSPFHLPSPDIRPLHSIFIPLGPMAHWVRPDAPFCSLDIFLRPCRPN